MKSSRGRRPTAVKKSTRPRAHARPARAAGSEPRAAADYWNLRLYVAGQNPRSLSAFANLKRLCEEHLPGRYHIEVIDLMKHPELAQADQVIALPTLVRKLPEPIKRIIGDLSNSDRVRVGMDLSPAFGQKSAS